MPFPEVHTALGTGVVDGQENPLATILASKLYEAQDYTVMSNHIHARRSNLSRDPPLGIA